MYSLASLGITVMRANTRERIGNMSRFFSLQHFIDLFPRLCRGIPLTLCIVLVSFAVGSILSVLLALAQLYRVPVARQFAIVYVSFMRGTPILIQLFICNLALPGLIWSMTGVNVGRIWPPIVFVIAAYALNAAAFLSETFRAAVSGVDAGQQDAAFAVGMTRIQSFRHVIAPQALRIALPGFANGLSNLLKDTSLAYSAAGILDLMGTATASAAATYRYLESYVGTAVIFFVLCLLLEYGTYLLSNRLSRGVAAAKRG
jgi:His/Glu/Gln/Arg/opine family amino acid ABC transporter permease subunit